MIVLGILVMLFAPYFVGACMITIFRERNAGHVNVYVTGLLSLFVFFLGFLMLALKLDLGIARLERYYFSFISILCLIGAIFSFKRRGEREKISKAGLWVMVPAALLALFSFVYLSPSIINDDTWETVTTTIFTGKIHEVSALTGRDMVAGLPIFNKIYVMPIYIACMCDFFNIPVRLMMQFLLPFIAYTCNLMLVYKISKELKVKNKNCFLLIYMLLLMAGTYLPKTGVPSTVGYALLREGYSGYAFAYGVAVPAMILLLYKKRYIHAAFVSLSILGLVRLDRVFFTIVKEPLKTFGFINDSGKIMIVYLVCVLAWIFIERKSNHSKMAWMTLAMPTVFISYIVVSILDRIYDKKRRIVYLLGVSVIILSTVSFMPFKDAETLKETLQYERFAKETLAQNDAYGKIIWADDKLMATARRVEPSVKTLYSRSSISDYMQGLYFEDESYAWDYYKLFRNEENFRETTVKNIYTLSRDADDITNHAYEEGLDIIIR